MTDFGRDVSCMRSIRSGRIVSGRRLVAEGFFRRLNTPRGTLRGEEEERDYGLDLEELIGNAQTASEVASLPGRIEAELRKDERADEIEVVVVEKKGTVGREFEISISATTSEGPFELVLSASEVSVEILGIRVE